MADGIIINTGTGIVVAAESIGTAFLQRVKLAVGNVDTDSGDISVTNPMPITGTVSALTTGTVNVVNVLSASGVTIASVATGTMNVVNVLSASGVTVASVATGTFSMSGTGNVTVANITTNTGGSLFVSWNGTQAFPNKFQAYVLATTSAAGGVIIQTSGANTIYITDVMVSVPSAMNVGLYSETTGPLAYVYLASNGGWAQSFTSPLVCTTAQSLRVILSSSGSCSVMAVGFTVT